MAHARQQIREAITAQLTGLATTGSNVFASRVHPMDDAHLPALAIYTLSEAVDADLDVGATPAGAVPQFRTLTVLVRGRAKAAVDLDDTLDDICAEVEDALYTDETLGGLVLKGLDLVSTEIEMAALDKPVGEARMTWQVVYRVDAKAPETLIN